MRLRKQLPLLIILALSFITHFAFFGYPSETVFDEVHFGKFISGYLTGEYFFDIHPPLGKLLITGMAWLGNFRPGFSFANIGDSFPDQQYLLLRFLPLLAGFFLPLVVYGVARRLTFSPWTALGASLFVALENALIVQSRFILIDAFLLLFGWLGLDFYLKYRLAGRQKYLWLASLMASLAISVKWTGGSFLVLIILAEAWESLKKISFWSFLPRLKTLTAWRNYLSVWSEWRLVLVKIGVLIGVPLLSYFAIFALHFQLLPNSGPGNAFMSPSFQKTLQNNPYQHQPEVKPLALSTKFIQLNLEMYRANQRLGAAHSYGSAWYSWPLMIRSVFYWQRLELAAVPHPENQIGRWIYLLGNPVIWWGSALVLSYWLIRHLSQTIIKKTKPIFSWPVNFLLAGYFLNLLPFIGIKRVMFLYHYFPALIFAILFWWWQIEQKFSDRKKKLAAGVLILGAVISFLFFAPLTYGLPRPVPELEKLLWLKTWR